MTKILLLSDTHSYLDDAILKHVADVDEVWHAGDIGDLSVSDSLKKLKPLRAVYGNIDNAVARSEFPLDLRFECEEVSVFMTHIGGYPGRYHPRIRTVIQEHPPRIFIAGHSHILKVMNDRKLKLLHMNPGAIGKHGFHKARTMLRFEIDGKEIQNLQVVEYKR